jgi:Xaa-Pro dipeptidase
MALQRFSPRSCLQLKEWLGTAFVPMGERVATERKLSVKQQSLEQLQPQMEVPFSIAEYEERLRRVREGMKKRQIDLLYLSAPESMHYLSGYQSEWYQAQSPKVWPAVSGIAVHVDHDRFILFDQYEEAVLARYQTVATDIRHFPRTKQTAAVDFVVSELKTTGWLTGPVGLEMWNYRPNRVISGQFQDAFESEGLSVVDGSDVVRDARAIKSPTELAYTQSAMRIADIGMNAAIAAARPGVTELEVYAELIAAMARAGGENPSITLPVLSGPKTASPHSLASRKTIMPGEIVVIDVCGVYHRYHANVARTLSMGEPHPDVADMHERSAGSYRVLEEIIRPNLPVTDLNAAVVQYYEEAGIWGEQRWVGGYELGVGFPPDWVGPWVYDPNLDAEGQVFHPGVVVNYESQYFLPQSAGLTLLIDTLMFTEDDARILSEVPRELIVVS